MGKGQKVITTVLWAALVCAMLGVVGFGMWDGRASRVTDPADAAAVDVVLDPSTAAGALPVLYPAPQFSLTNQDNKPVASDDLRGHAWVAAFIFTHCAGPCPMMSAKMAELQKTVPDKNVKLVSFTVDPERDTPEVLKKYAATFNADSERWYFLTGEKSAIYAVADGMHLTAQPVSENDVLHDTRFLLIDPQGQVRGVYSSKDPSEMKQLAADAQRLANP
jgi:cytochrome oxidase Cu insertion factor (SCO1/SenC/PrrC family)